MRTFQRIQFDLVNWFDRFKITTNLCRLCALNCGLTVLKLIQNYKRNTFVFAPIFHELNSKIYMLEDQQKQFNNVSNKDQCVPVPAYIQQLRTAIEEEWTNIPQTTINNLINSMRRRCVALREANGGHTRYGLVFWPPPPNTVKLHIFEWPFIMASLRHTCTIIMLSNQHLDIPHLWGGWIISAKEKCSLIFIFVSFSNIFLCIKVYEFI